MKLKVYLISIAICFSALKSKTFAQTSYTLTFGNNQNYYTTCGDNNASQWTVYYEHGSCFLYTPILNPAGSGMVEISYSFRINQAGNNTVYDTLRLEFYTVNDGWEVIHTVLGNQYNEVNYDITGDLTVDASEYIVFRLNAIISVNNSFWAVKKDNTTFTVDNVNPTNDFLPVSLISFFGFSENNHAEIHWATYSEVNNNFFTIERSENNSLFYPAGFVQGAGNSNTSFEYSFTDPEELTSDLTYYRLRQTDFDGSTEVFNTISVNKTTHFGQKLRCYFDDSNLNIIYVSDRDSDVSIFIIDSFGILIEQHEMHLIQGINTFTWPSTLKVHNKGLFLVTIIDKAANTYCSSKFIL